MAVVIVTAFILSKGQDEDGASPKAFKRIMIITCIVCGLILPENYSTGMLLFGTVYLMMFIGRVSARKLLILGGGIVAFVTVFVALPTRRKFLPPNSTSTATGKWHMPVLP